MGQLVKLPNCREVSPELLRSIARRTRTPAYWVRYLYVYWSVVNILVSEMDPGEVDHRAIEDVWVRVLGWLYDRNRAAIKARGYRRKPRHGMVPNPIVTSERKRRRRKSELIYHY